LLVAHNLISLRTAGHDDGIKLSLVATVMKAIHCDRRWLELELLLGTAMRTWMNPFIRLVTASYCFVSHNDERPISVNVRLQTPLGSLSASACLFLAFIDVFFLPQKQHKKATRSVSCFYCKSLSFEARSESISRNDGERSLMDCKSARSHHFVNNPNLFGSSSLLVPTTTTASSNFVEQAKNFLTQLKIQSVE
jgi:hypothetical protein